MSNILSPIIRDKIFWQFTVFLWNFDSPQVKRKLISSTKNFVKKLNDSRLRNLGNQKKISKLSENTGQCPVSFPEIISDPVELCFTFLPSCNYFVTACRQTWSGLTRLTVFNAINYLFKALIYINYERINICIYSFIH